MYSQGKTHLVVMLCLGAALLGLFFCPDHNASSLPSFFILLAALSGSQTYRSVKEEQNGTNAQRGTNPRSDA